VLTFSARHSRFSPLTLLGDRHSPQSGESRPLLAKLAPVQLPQSAGPPCRSPYLSPQMQSAPYPLKFTFVYFILVP